MCIIYIRSVLGVGSPNGSLWLNVMELVFEGIRSVPEVGASNRSDENIF